MGPSTPKWIISELQRRLVTPATTSERPGLVRVNSYIRSLENPRWKQIKSYASPKGVIFTPHGLLGVVTFQKKKYRSVTQGETEYTDFRKWRVMRSQMAYVPTGKTVVFQWQLQVGHHTCTQTQSKVGRCRG